MATACRGRIAAVIWVDVPLLCGYFLFGCVDLFCCAVTNKRIFPSMDPKQQQSMFPRWYSWVIPMNIHLDPCISNSDAKSKKEDKKRKSGSNQDVILGRSANASIREGERYHAIRLKAGTATKEH